VLALGTRLLIFCASRCDEIARLGGRTLDGAFRRGVSPHRARITLTRPRKRVRPRLTRQLRRRARGTARSTLLQSSSRTRGEVARLSGNTACLALGSRVVAFRAVLARRGFWLVCKPSGETELRRRRARRVDKRADGCRRAPRRALVDCVSSDRALRLLRVSFDGDEPAWLRERAACCARGLGEGPGRAREARAGPRARRNKARIARDLFRSVVVRDVVARLC